MGLSAASIMGAHRLVESIVTGLRLAISLPRAICAGARATEADSGSPTEAGRTPRRLGGAHGKTPSGRGQELMQRSQGKSLVLAAFAAGLAMAAAAGGAMAQGTDGPWWEAIPGFGRSESQPRRTSDDDPRRR